MAELVDALASGASGRKAIEVQILLGAHGFKHLIISLIIINIIRTWASGVHWTSDAQVQLV